MFILRKKILLIFLLLSVVTLLACAKENTPVEDKQPLNTTTENNRPKAANDEAINIIDTLMLTAEEKSYINGLQEKGTLSIATTLTKGTYEVIDGQVKGYSHGIAEKFAKDLSLSLEVKVIHDFEDFFKYNGVFSSSVFTDPSIEYTPDLFKEVDIYIDLLTPIPWREQLMHIINLLPIREVIVHSTDTSIQSFEDLDGLTVAISPVTSFYTTLQETAIKQDIKLNYLFTNTATESLDAINNGQADFTVMDSNLAFLEVDSNPSLQVGLPIAPINHLGWAVKKDDQLLASILEKYWNAIKTSGDFNQLWLQDYQANYFDYYRFITNNLSAMETIPFTEEERLFIRNLQEKGVLKVALQESPLCYNIVNGEHTGYNYLLANNLAVSLGLDLEITIANDPSDYFTLNGETPTTLKEDSTLTYIPDLLKEVDLYAVNLTHVPWRQQILNQINMIPSKAVFVTHKDAGIRTFQDLNHKKIGLVKESSYDLLLTNLIQKYNLNLEIIDFNNSMEAYEAINNKTIDATMTDSIVGLLEIKVYKDLMIHLPADDYVTLGWAVKKEDEIFASILSKYIDTTKQNGRFEEFWRKTFDFSYVEYLRLLAE